MYFSCDTMKIVYVVFISCCLIEQYKAEGDMWDRILSSNKEHFEKQLKQSRSNAAYEIVYGDVLRDNVDTEQEHIARAAMARKATVYGPVNWHRRLWFMRDIPYTVNHPGDPGWQPSQRKSAAEVKRVIRKSLDMITKATKGCLRFKEYRHGQLPYSLRRGMPTNKNWLEIFKGVGCYSGIGRKYYKDTPTRISLGNNCVSPYVVIHEVFHALGFHHEQSRRDRDSYVRVNKYNIQSANYHNFDKVEAGEMDAVGTPYDLDSIMHYSRKLFIKPNVRGNTVEYKFDPNRKLGSGRLTETDINEVTKLYQCNIQSGWSNWFEWSPCIKDWRGNCERQRGRFCISGDCVGMDEYGTDNIVEKCDMGKCTNPAIDGHWGNWGKYTACDKPRGWGVQSRTRRCDNPPPSNGGKSCPGNRKEFNVCRQQKAYKSPWDNDFEDKRLGRWTVVSDARVQGWKVRIGKGPNNAGPKWAWSGGVYAVFQGFRLGYGKKSDLISPLVWAHPKVEKCLIFHYQLNGEQIHPKYALSVFTKQVGGRGKISTFYRSERGGHVANHWVRMAITVPKMTYNYKVHIRGVLGYGKDSDVAVDQIQYDSYTCPKGLNGPCKDHHAQCIMWASAGKCTSDRIRTIRMCCKSCSTSRCVDTHKKCKKWACDGECKKNPKWMLPNCCRSCKSGGEPCQRKCSTNKYERSDDCDRWAKGGECQKNAVWMLPNCCYSCERYGKKQ